MADSKMTPLPIDQSLEAILSHLRKTKNLVLSAAPGAGKTTRLPPALMSLTETSQKKILVLEPRRLAAVSAAARIAEEQNWQLGDQVGYQIRFDSNFQKSTQLIFLTEALLNRKLLEDPELLDVGIVVLDEFHERSQHVDLALGLLKELQQLSRPDLKIVVMSATLTAEPIARFLEDAQIVKVPGQSHPLEITHQKTAQKLRTTGEFIDDVAAQIRTASHNLATGEHLLVFLPGVGEIERVFRQIEIWATERKTLVLKLHGNLSLEEQRKVLLSTSQSKIILSTNIAESSLTIDGVRAVVDTGLQRRASVNPKTGFPQLDLARISKSSATQRAGRAARQAPGKCYQMWSSLDELSMPQEEVAEILRTDLSEAVLFLSAQGVRDFARFSWFESPSKEALAKAEKHLRYLQALDLDNHLTELGKKILKFPLPPRLGKLLLIADRMGIRQTGAEIAALLLERDILQKRLNEKSLETPHECDLLLRLDLYHHGRYPVLDRVVSQLLRHFSRPTSAAKPADHLQIRKLLLESFSDQICRRRKPREERAVMIGGRGISLEAASQVRDSEFFIALQLMEGHSASDTKVALACGVDKELVLQMPNAKIETKAWLDFDEETQKFMKREAPNLVLPLIGGLPIADVRSQPARAEDIQEKLAEVAFQKRFEIIEKNEALKAWWQRFEIWKKYSSPNNNSEASPTDEKLIDENLAESDLEEIFAMASYGENSLTALYAKDLVGFFERKLEAVQLERFKTECPEFLQVPSGSKIRLDYSGTNPSLQVRLQEVFGLSETPKIAKGQLSLTLVLLAPNYRPVQVTQDLKSFWKNAYPEVRSELRARYPKHSWPDDPLTAPPQAKGRPRK